MSDRQQDRILRTIGESILLRLSKVWVLLLLIALTYLGFMVFLDATEVVIG